MAGIYIHIPFCKKACYYCDFHFSTSLRFKDKMVSSIIKEIKIQKHYFEQEKIETIYFGGGTPSLLNYSEINSILNEIYYNFNVIENPEITLEANPDDLKINKLEQLKKNNINRLSIGIQSFFDEHLKWMNRAHTSKNSIECLKNAKKIGFNNITIDLIYGMPNITNHQWKENIKQAINYNIPHISAYNLTLEKNTAYYSFVKKGIYKKPSDKKGAEQFSILIKELKKASYIHYEISNFAKKDNFSKHNSSYWKGKKYLGIGPSAHSFNGSVRHWNISNNKRYIDSIELGKPKYTIEELTNKDIVNEHLLLGLRTIWGCSLPFIQNKLTENTFNTFILDLEKQKKISNIQQDKNKIVITDKGKPFTDRIISDLFV